MANVYISDSKDRILKDLLKRLENIGKPIHPQDVGTHASVIKDILEKRAKVARRIRR